MGNAVVSSAAAIPRALGDRGPRQVVDPASPRTRKRVNCRRMSEVNFLAFLYFIFDSSVSVFPFLFFQVGKWAASPPPLPPVQRSRRTRASKHVSTATRASTRLRQGRPTDFSMEGGRGGRGPLKERPSNLLGWVVNDVMARYE